jgi:hypothetical protein
VQRIMPKMREGDLRRPTPNRQDYE